VEVEVVAQVQWPQQPAAEALLVKEVVVRVTLQHTQVVVVVAVQLALGTVVLVVLG
jgi:hypothetical protein